MSAARKTAVVICPGRGVYNKAELGYLQRHHADKKTLVDSIDELRRQNNQLTISGLDSSHQFDASIHTRSDNAPSLIYACAYADFLSIDQSRYEIVAITGNSMGWYIALACASVLAQQDATRLINHMGNTMQTQTGGQIIIPLLDERWQPIPDRLNKLEVLMAQINQRDAYEIFDSIFLGGYRIVAGNDAALDQLQHAFEDEVAPPVRLTNHAAFHTPLMQAARDQAHKALPEGLFQPPSIPLIDGRGQTWQPQSSEISALWNYTLGHQITRPYNFSKAVQVAVQEFAPDILINLGPGNTLGGAIAQALVEINWQGLDSKQAFVARQNSNPLLVSMGLSAQRKMVAQ